MGTQSGRQITLGPHTQDLTRHFKLQDWGNFGLDTRRVGNELANGELADG